MKFKKIISLFLMAISILFVTTAAAEELQKYKLILELDDSSVLEKDNIEYLEILLQNGENVSVIYLEKANDWKVETELIPGTYKIIIRNISPSKYLISNDYSVTVSDKDVVSKIDVKEFPDTEEVNEKPKKSQEIKKEPVKEKDMEQHQTASQNLKTRSIKIAMTVILCTLAAAIILIILYFISKIIR